MIKIKLFLYSLRDRARTWLNSLLPESIHFWNELTQKFVLKFKPPTMDAMTRNENTSFRQMDDENLH
ncbi:hypothetical protein GQ457_07G005050 [Hibiscus cannabinus]